MRTFRPARRPTWPRACGVAVAALCLVPPALLAADGPATRPAADRAADDQAAIARLLTEAVKRYDKVLEQDPTLAEAWQRRGIAHFRLGHVEKAVADFDKYLELDPEAKPHHWQRGIALYYAGRYGDGAKQFELHRTVNPEDVENAAWHFLCVARAARSAGATADEAVKKARAVLIPVKDDARVPMAQVQALFAGTATADDVMAAAKAGNPDAESLRERMFYAHLYLGLYDEAAGRDDEARRHVAAAAGEFATPDYMGDVARVHAARMAAGATTRPAR